MIEVMWHQKLSARMELRVLKTLHHAVWLQELYI